jgi:DNA-binding winged helix-turn-helix (wHTH) protein
MTIAFGQFELNSRRHVLRGPGGEAQLSPLASRLLEVLARQPGGIVDRGTIIEELWRGDWLVGDPALNRVVSELRRAVGDDPRSPTLIQTVPRRGYRLVAHAEGATPGPAPRGLFPGWPHWQRVWGLSILTLLAVLGGLSLFFVTAMLAHN